MSNPTPIRSIAVCLTSKTFTWSTNRLRNAITSITSPKSSPFSSSSSLSGLQREVLALYRTILRSAYQKEGSNNGFVQALQDGCSNTAYASEEFKRQAGQVRKNDFRTIEYKIRHGYKQVKLLQMPGVTKVMVGGGRSKKKQE